MEFTTNLISTDLISTDLIYRNLAEVIGKESIESKLSHGKTLTCYIGFAPTGQIHIGYLVPCMKIRDLTLAGCKVAIMVADVHALLDERKTPTHLVDARSQYYQLTLTKILEVLGAKMENIKFVRGSEFQHTADYSMDVWELCSRVTISAAKKAGTEVVKQDKDPKLGSAIYPIMQAVDENYVGQTAFGGQVDMELGGVDQRKIFCFSLEHDRKDGKISYLMNPIISLSKTGKMSASDANSKIGFMDSDTLIESKIGKAFCCDGDTDCGLMKLMKCVFFALADMNHPIKVEADDNMILAYTDYDQFEKDFLKQSFVAIHLKKTITELICDVIAPVREYLFQNIHLIHSAYPG